MVVVYVPFINLCFHIFLILAIGSIFLVIRRKNPISAIFAFIIFAIMLYGLLFIIGAEFIALVVIIIYTGVIAVLFLFVVLMYNLHTLNLSWFTKSFSRAKRWRNRIIIFIVVLYMQAPFTAVTASFCNPELAVHARYGIPTSIFNTNKEHWSALDDTIISVYVEDVSHLSIIFNQYGIILIICGLLLFIAMVGSIVITYPFSKDFNK